MIKAAGQSASTSTLKIAEPGYIGPLKFKNRLMLAPMGTNYSTTDGTSTDRDHRYYVERARGGVAMVMTEAMVTTDVARNHRNSLCAFHDRFIPGLARLVESIKAEDCFIFGQLSHRGGLLKRSVMNAEPVSASAWNNPNTGEPVRELSTSEITEIQKNFVTAAKRLYRAGYDGVELHGANGYLFHQFFTPRVNKRTDHYGGSVENRARLLMETVSRIRDEMPDWPLLVRISATEYVEGGYSMKDVIELSLLLEKAGISALDLSGGTNEHPELSRFCIQPPSMARRCLEPYARPIKDAVKIPVIIAGRIIDPEDAEGILQDEGADFISLGRALIADPHWPLKAFGKISQPIRKCISCNVCFERLTLEVDVSCVQNPMVGTEFESTLERHPSDAPKKRVLILGGGVAGAETARTLLEEGHQVEIWEKTAQLGGQVPLAVAAPDKMEVEPVWSYRWDQIKDSVSVKLSMTATKEAIEAFAPDFIVVATGSSPRMIKIPGLADGELMHAWDVLADATKVPDGSAVTVIGGGMVGIEVADLLITRGCKVTIIEATKTTASQMARNNRVDILVRLKDAGVKILLETKVEGVEGDKLIVSADGKRVELPRDPSLIVAIGPQPNRAVVPLVESTGIPYAIAGDALRAGDFQNAIQDGWMIGLAINGDKRPVRSPNAAR